MTVTSFADVASESCRARALKAVDDVTTGAAILTRDVFTLVYICYIKLSIRLKRRRTVSAAIGCGEIGANMNLKIQRSSDTAGMTPLP